MDNRMVVLRAWGWNGDMQVKGYKHSIVRTSSKGLMYSIVIDNDKV